MLSYDMSYRSWLWDQQFDCKDPVRANKDKVKHRF